MEIYIEEINTLQHAVKYYNDIKNTSLEEELIINFIKAKFIRNHYLSIIGMAIEVVKKRGVIVKIKKPIEKKVLDSMIKIGFLTVFCNTKNRKDTHNTMVRYTNIPIENYGLDLQKFYSYFMRQFMGKIDNLSPILLKKILQKFFELFSNVFRHSQSALGFFCSGQFYPKNNKFNFTIVDNGVTIKSNVNKYLLKKHIEERSFSEKIFKKFKPLNGLEAIEWALVGNHSTTGSGGLGLSLLMELIKVSDGDIEIISGDGYFSTKQSKVLEKPFDGTIISVELDTNKDKYYFLKEEVNANT